jgi:hypothetical protein
VGTCLSIRRHLTGLCPGIPFCLGDLHFGIRLFPPLLDRQLSWLSLVKSSFLGGPPPLPVMLTWASASVACIFSSPLCSEQDPVKSNPLLLTPN